MELNYATYSLRGVKNHGFPQSEVQLECCWFDTWLKQNEFP